MIWHFLPFPTLWTGQYTAQRMKKVLVIGGGFSGISVCKSLCKDPSVEVTLVDAREGFLLNKFATLRAAVVGEEWTSKVMAPIDALSNIKFVHDRLVRVVEKENIAEMASGLKIHYDAICIATGARNFSPGEPPLSITSKADTTAYFSRMQDAIQKAKKVVIYGAGLVGIELAGEILDTYQAGKSVFLVNPKTHGSVAGNLQLSAKQESSLRKLLAKEKGLTVLENLELNSPTIPTGDLSQSDPLIVNPGSVTFTNGKNIKDVDLVIFCLGGRFQADMVDVFPSSWIHVLTGEIKVINTFQIESSSSNAFALGDVAKTGHARLGMWHMEDALVVAGNMLALLKNKPLVTNKSTVHLTESPPSSTMGISFGRYKGRIFVSGWTLGNFWARRWKSRSLYTQEMHAKLKA